MSSGPVIKSMALAVVLALVASGCSGSSPDENASPPISSEATAGTETSTTTEPVETTPPAPESDPDDLRELWNRVWVASGLVPRDREAAVAEIATQLDPEVAEAIPEIVPAPEEREVLTDPVFSTNADGSIDIRDCAIYTPPYRGFTATHIHEGRAIPDGEGGWIIEQISREGQGCVPAAMADQILADYNEYFQAFNESGNPPDPDHPSLAKTMRGEYLEDVIAGTQDLVDEGWYYEDFDISNPEVVEVLGSRVTRVRDCIELDPRSG